MRTTLYIGITNDIERRIKEHLNGEGSKFTHKYNLHELLYFETFNDIEQAITREKQLKNWHREWKFNLIKQQNPTLKNLASDW